MRSKAFGFAVICGAAILFAGCMYEPDVGPPLAGECDPADSDPENDVSFARDVRPIFDRREGGCGCHSPSSPRPVGIQLGGFNAGTLETIRQGGLHSGSQIIVPGDPCSSLLVQKVSEAPPVGARMPLNGPPFLSPEEVQLIHDWIAEGALDN